MNANRDLVNLLSKLIIDADKNGVGYIPISIKEAEEIVDLLDYYYEGGRLDGQKN